MDRKRLLVVRGGAIGDFLLTLPALRLLRDGFPDCELELIGYRHICTLAERRFYAHRVRSIEYAPMAGFFNPRTSLDPELSEYFASFGQIISYLFDPDGFFEANLRRCGVKHLLSADPRVTEDGHAATQLARPLESLGLFLDHPSATFFPSPEDQFAADECLSGIRESPILVHPGSGSSRKNWPLAAWAELLSRLARRPEPLVVVGGESDAAQLASLRQTLPKHVDFLENLPLCTLGAVLARAKLFIGHDSGISHLAAAAGARCLLIFGPTNPDVWAPANPAVTTLRAPDGILENLSRQSVETHTLELLK